MGLSHKGKYKGQIAQPSWNVEGYYRTYLSAYGTLNRLMALTVPDCTIEEYLKELARLNDEVVL